MMIITIRIKYLLDIHFLLSLLCFIYICINRLLLFFTICGVFSGTGAMIGITIGAMAGAMDNATYSE